MIKNLKKNKKGFTLIELIVVIAILAILAAIAVPRVIGFQDSARAQANKQVAVQVKNAVAVGLAGGEIKIGGTTPTGNIYIYITNDATPPGAAVTLVPNAAVTTFVQPTSDANAITYINGFIDSFRLQNVGGLAQSIVVRISNTEVDVITINTPAATPDWATCNGYTFTE